MNANPLPINKEIIFEPVAHRYFHQGRELKSVTAVTGKLKPAFDSQRMSLRVANRRGISQEDVLKEWEKTRDEAGERGRQLHSAVEAFLTTGEIALTMPLFRQWHKWWSGIMVPAAVEYIIADLGFGIAGTVDLVGWSPKTNLYHVLDWKTNKNFTVESKYGDRLLVPFSELEYSDLEGYSLQVSLYRLMLERQGVETGDSWICHVTPENCEPYRAKDYRQRLLDWLR